MRTHLMTLMLAGSLLSTPAFAETNPPAPSNSNLIKAQSQSSPSTNHPAGMQAVNTGTLALRFVTIQPADVLSSKLMGTDVYNKQNESIGEIEDLVIDNGKQLRAIVIGVGGFLGIGERYVAVDPATVVLVRDGDSWRARVDTSKDDLKKAPTFEYKSWRRQAAR